MNRLVPHRNVSAEAPSSERISVQQALQHFFIVNQPTRKGVPRQCDVAVSVQGWAYGKQVSSVSEVMPADRWLIHYIPYKVEVGTGYPTSSAIHYVEHIILIDNCGQPYSLTRDLRSCTIPQYTINHQPPLKDLDPLPPCYVSLYKTVATQDMTMLCAFTQSLQVLAKEKKESDRVLAEMKLTLAASIKENIGLRAELETCNAALIALL
jgi:hypothetical protein